MTRTADLDSPIRGAGGETGGLDPTLPAVVMGDFNFMEREPEYRILRDVLGLADPPVELGKRQATVYGANPYRVAKREKGGPARRKDYVFRRDARHRALVPIEVSRVFDEEFQLSGHPAAASDHAGVLVDFDVVPAAGGAVAPPPPLRTLALAEELLRRGREAALQRASSQTDLAWGGILATLAAVGSVRAPAISRRRFMRGALRGSAALTLLPTASLSLASQMVVPREVEAFDRAVRRLAELDLPPADVAANARDESIEDQAVGRGSPPHSS